MATVIYDADCGFCKWCLALLLAWDRPRVNRSGGERGRPSPPTLQGGWERSAASYALRPLPLGTPEADQLLADLSVEERNASWHLIVGAETTPRMPAAGAETTSRTPAAGACPAAGASGAAAAAGPARFSAGGALAPALALLPHGRIPSALVSRIPRSTERGYRWVADHRGPLGRFVPARARRWAHRVIAAHGGPRSQ